MSPTTDQVHVSHQNDFEGIVSLYSPVFFRVAFLRLRNIEDAEDAVQEALLSAHKCIGQFQGRSKLSTWLTRIVTNAALMKLRRYSRYEMLPLGEGSEINNAPSISELVYSGPNPESIYAQTEMNETLTRGLARLSPKLRAAIQLCDLEGISTGEAAKALGVSKNTMKSRVGRARKKLGLILGKHLSAHQAATPLNGEVRTGIECRSRGSAAGSHTSASDQGRVKSKPYIFKSSFSPVSNHKVALNRTVARDDDSGTNYVTHSVEAAAPRDPLGIATQPGRPSDSQCVDSQA